MVAQSNDEESVADDGDVEHDDQGREKPWYPYITKTQFEKFLSRLQSKVPDEIDRDYVRAIIRTPSMIYRFLRGVEAMGLIDSEQRPTERLTGLVSKDTRRQALGEVVGDLYPGLLEQYLAANGEMADRDVVAFFRKDTGMGNDSANKMKMFFKYLLSEADIEGLPSTATDDSDDSADSSAAAVSEAEPEADEVQVEEPEAVEEETPKQKEPSTRSSGNGRRGEGRGGEGRGGEGRGGEGRGGEDRGAEGGGGEGRGGEGRGGEGRGGEGRGSEGRGSEGRGGGGGRGAPAERRTQGRGGDRHERGERTDRNERADRTERSERPDRTERTDRGERAERVPSNRPLTEAQRAYLDTLKSVLRVNVDGDWDDDMIRLAFDRLERLFDRVRRS